METDYSSSVFDSLYCRSLGVGDGDREGSEGNKVREGRREGEGAGRQACLPIDMLHYRFH